MGNGVHIGCVSRFWGILSEWIVDYLVESLVGCLVEPLVGFLVGWSA